MKLRLILMASICLLFQYTSAQQTTIHADQLLGEAFKKAKKDKKNVLVIFTASWCINCYILKDSVINNPAIRNYFNDNYEITYLHVLETGEKKSLEIPGAKELLAKYDGLEAGLPFFIILDKNGKLLSDAFLKPDPNDKTKWMNIGRPFLAEEVDHFLKMLKATSFLSEIQLKMIANKCNPELFKLN